MLGRSIGSMIGYGLVAIFRNPHSSLKGTDAQWSQSCSSNSLWSWETFGDIPIAKSTARKSLWRKHRVQSRTGHRTKQISTTLTVWRPREPEYTRDWSQMSRYWRDLVLVYIYWPYWGQCIEIKVLWPYRYRNLQVATWNIYAHRHISNITEFKLLYIIVNIVSKYIIVVMVTFLMDHHIRHTPPPHQYSLVSVFGYYLFICNTKLTLMRLIISVSNIAK